MSRQAEKIVYFLGAGFSKAVAKLPTMDNFLKVEDVTKDTYPYMDKFIKNFFKDTKDTKFNLEEIFSYIEIGLGTSGEKIEAPLRMLGEARKELERYMVQRLYEELQERKRDKEFDGEFTRHVERLGKPFESSYAILTLNYDSIIESILPFPDSEKIRKLRDLLRVDRISNGELVEEFSENMFLKLHGSLNWLCCSDFGCPFTVEKPIPEQKLDAIDPEKRTECKICHSPLSRLIIPPSLHKSSSKFNPLILRIWRLAKEVLLRADKIVIIGVSFAESDYHLKWLFKSAIAGRGNNLPRIEVVNKDACVCNKVKDITGITPEFEMSLDKHLINQTAEND